MGLNQRFFEQSEKSNSSPVIGMAIRSEADPEVFEQSEKSNSSPVIGMAIRSEAKPEVF